ncbi:hypothetical protein IWW50_006017, partial [Coemansia erecta]
MSGQPNLGGLGANGGDWRAMVTEQARSNHLVKLAGNMLQGLNDHTREMALKLIYQFETQAYANASSVQEYSSILSTQLDTLLQKIKAMSANNAANNAMAQSGAAVNPAVPALQGVQFTQPAHTPTLAHAQPQPQQPAAPARPQNAMNSHMAKLIEVVHNLEGSTTQDLTIGFQILQAIQGPANANPANKQV